MSFLTPEELEKLQGAESLFPSPIPVQNMSSDEFMPSPQTPGQREFESRIKESGARIAKQLGMSRRRFFKTAGGMAAAFVAMNEVYAKTSEPIYEVARDEAVDLRLAQARADALKGQFVMDMHTHYLRDGTPIRAFVAQREAVGKAGWNPLLAGKPQTIDDLMFPNYFKEIFLDSDTKMACISGSYSMDEKFSFLTNQMKADTRERINREAGGTRRMFSHAIFTPGWPNWLEKVEEENERLKPDSWKGYTIGDNTNKHLSKHPFRLDDEKVMYPFYEKLVAFTKKYPDRPGLKNVCIHKGLFSPSVAKQFPHLLGYCNVDDVGKAAKDWPQLNFVIYHSAYRWIGGPDATAGNAWAQVQRTGRVEWVSDLADIPGQFGVSNVYADLGQIFAHSNMAEPKVAAFMLGQMIKGLGADHVVWGTDALWTGAPQWQIEALRRMEIPEDIRKYWGFAAMGPADGPVKRAILGENNARLYGVTPAKRAELATDKVAGYKKLYDAEGGDRTNRAYGYVLKSGAKA
jgi:predicted TIM-barrel fold metal-dependent hydrolase